MCSLPSSRMSARTSRIWFGIEAGGGLVEDEERRLGDERVGEPDALAVALREVADEHVGDVRRRAPAPCARSHDARGARRAARA